MDSRERDYDRERYRDRDDRPRQDYRESRDRWDVVQSVKVLTFTVVGPAGTGGEATAGRDTELATSYCCQILIVDLVMI